MNNTKYFSYIGNAYPHKNLDRLVKAMSLLNKNKNEKVILKISSSRNIFTARLQDMIANNNAQEFVELLGYVPDNEINEFLKKSVAFVFPTLAEGFGIPPMEAIVAGTIVVQSDIPVLKEIYEDTTLYFNPLDVKDMVRVMEEALKMSELERQKRIKYAQNFLKKYSWKKMAEETVKIYESVK
jgi:glycosyltransferase involved in cell wall biosynthesis